MELPPLPGSLAAWTETDAKPPDPLAPTPHAGRPRATRGVIAVAQQWPDRLEVRLRDWSDKHLDVLRAVPGRRWDPDRRRWVLPDPEASAAFLRARFGAAGIWIEVVDGGPGDDGLLDRTRRALVLRGYSPRTRKVYLGHIRRFLSRTGGDAENLAAAGSAQIAERYLFDLIGEGGVSRSYHSQVVSALRFLFETVLGNRDVALTIPRPRKERHLPDVMSPEQVAKILTKPRNLKHRALLMLLYSSGLRVSEIVRLRPGDLDPDRRTVKVRRGKGGKDRYTLLARRAAEAVRIYRESYGTGPWLFPGARHGRHLTPRSVQRIVQAAARAAGIETKVTPHTLRHSFATHLLESGTNLRIIQELLGHTSPTTTQIYTHVANTAIETVRSPLDNLADHEAPA